MAHLIAWVVVLPVAIAWFAASSALWFSFMMFGWKRPARAVGAGPIVPLERAVARALRAIHRGLLGGIGLKWTAAVYAAIVVLLGIIGYLSG